MTVQLAPSPAVAAAPPQPFAGMDSSYDARWDAWVERGRQHDLASQRKLRIAVPGALVIGALVAFYFGLA